MPTPKVIDDDKSEIRAEVNGHSVRSWEYHDDAGRRLRMQKAHEFAEGWYQAELWGGSHKASQKMQDALEGLKYVHDSNPSDAMANTPPLDYARHILMEVRRAAHDALTPDD